MQEIAAPDSNKCESVGFYIYHPAEITQANSSSQADAEGVQIGVESITHTGRSIMTFFSLQLRPARPLTDLFPSDAELCAETEG